MSIPKAKDITFNDIKFSKPKIDERSRKTIFLNTNSGNGIILMTPKMVAPGGIKEWKEAFDPKNPNATMKPSSFEMELSFNLDVPEIKEFHDKMKEYDDFLLKNIHANSSEWLGKDLSMATIKEGKYHHTVRPSLDKQGKQTAYPDRFKTRLTRMRDSDNNVTSKFTSDARNNIELMVRDHKGNVLQLTSENYEKVVPKGSSIIAVVALSHISIGAEVSSIWKLKQFLVYQNKKVLDEFVIEFEKDSDEENEPQKEALQEDLKEDLEEEESLEEPLEEEVLEETPLEEEELVDKVETLKIEEKTVKKTRKKNVV